MASNAYLWLLIQSFLISKPWSISPLAFFLYLCGVPPLSSRWERVWQRDLVPENTPSSRARCLSPTDIWCLEVVDRNSTRAAAKHQRLLLGLPGFLLGLPGFLGSHTRARGVSHFTFLCCFAGAQGKKVKNELADSELLKGFPPAPRLGIVVLVNDTNVLINYRQACLLQRLWIVIFTCWRYYLGSIKSDNFISTHTHLLVTFQFLLREIKKLCRFRWNCFV